MTTRGRKIPEGLHEELFAVSLGLNPRTKAPYTDKELAAWLAKRDVHVSHDCVTDTLRPYREAARKARLERIRAIAADDVAEHLITHRDLMKRLAKLAKETRSTETRIRASAEFRKGLEALVRASTGTDNVKLTGSPEGLAEFLALGFGQDHSGDAS